MKVRLASNHAYIISGSKIVQSVFRSAKNLSFDAEFFQILQRVYSLPEGDATLLCGNSPAECKKTVHGLEKLYAAHLASPRATSSLIGQFLETYTQELETFENQEWTEVEIHGFLRQAMSKAAISALIGPNIFKRSPSFVEDYWQFDTNFKSLLYGMPTLLCQKETLARDRVLEKVKSFLTGAWDRVDWNNEQQIDADWEPVFGSRMVRELEKFLHGLGISVHGRASIELSLIFASVPLTFTYYMALINSRINSNAIPTTTWILNEIIKTPTLHQQIYQEIQGAVITHSKEKAKLQCLDLVELPKLPCLASLYSECLRFHLSAQLGRRLNQDMEVGGYLLKAGNAVIAPTWLGHRDESIWSKPGHSPNEVWPERFLHLDSTKPGDFFPFGTGVATCPARNYAKQEILIAVALMLLKFDIQPLHFINPDGSVRHRSPEPLGGEGMGSGRPDCGFLVRMRKRMV